MSSPRTYRLGIDLGTTYSAAVVSRREGGGSVWGEPEIVALGSRSASVASVLYLGEDGTVLVGEAAERRGLTEPDRVVRQFKRRIGDDVPLVVGNAVHTAHQLAATMARWVVDRVAEREGGPAEKIAVTHPAAWGDHKKELLAGALRAVDLDGVTFLPEPQAAAVAYSARERVDSGGSVAVYDLGGGTFDAAIVRRTEGGFELPGRPEGIEQLGGVDFDDRVFDHVRAGIGAGLDALDFEDPEVVSAVLRLRRECVEAKEALSFDTQTSIPVMLPGIRTTVRITRVEFEASIRSSIDHTVDALRRTVESAGLSPDGLQAVLLVGGSSRIPLVAQMISGELGRPVAVDSDPKTSIAMGAALTVAPRAERPTAPSAAPPPPAPSGGYPTPEPARPATGGHPDAEPTPTVPAPARAPLPEHRTPPSAEPEPAAASSGSSPGTPEVRAFVERGENSTRTNPPASSAPATAPERPRSAPGYPGGGQEPPAPYSNAPAPGYSPHGVAPEHQQGRYLSQPGPPSGPWQGGPQQWGEEEEEEDSSGSTVRTVLIILFIALVLFGAALGAGALIKANRPTTTNSTPKPNAAAAAPDLPAERLVF